MEYWPRVGVSCLPVRTRSPRPATRMALVLLTIPVAPGTIQNLEPIGRFAADLRRNPK
jgi:hypothetical protein